MKWVIIITFSFYFTIHSEMIQQKVVSKEQSRHKPFEKEEILAVLASELVRTHGGTVQYYLENLEQLNTLITQDEQFRWIEMAITLNMDRWRLYHWFHETFQRSLLAEITQDDKKIIYDQIHHAIQNFVSLDKFFQLQLKSKLSQNYHRTTFSIQFNNIKRKVIKMLGGMENIPKADSVVAPTKMQWREQQWRQKIRNSLKSAKISALDIELASLLKKIE